MLPSKKFNAFWIVSLRFNISKERGFTIGTMLWFACNKCTSQGLDLRGRFHYLFGALLGNRRCGIWFNGHSHHSWREWSSYTWWRHQLEIFSALLALCAGNSPVTGEFDRWIPGTGASDAELWCFLWSAPWINGWVNNREAGDLRCHRAHYDVIVMCTLVKYIDNWWWGSQ